MKELEVEANGLRNEVKELFPDFTFDQRTQVLLNAKHSIEENIKEGKEELIERQKDITKIKTATTKEALVEIVKDLDSDHAYQAYRRLAGEVEARNVEARSKMTPEERRKSLLSETEDVARDQQLVILNDLMQPSYSELGETLITEQTEMAENLYDNIDNLKSVVKDYKFLGDVFDGAQDRRGLLAEQRRMGLVS